jgi:hypothetical protein
MNPCLKQCRGEERELAGLVHLRGAGAWAVQGHHLPQISVLESAQEEKSHGQKREQ